MCVSAGGNVTPRLLPDQMIYTDPKNEKETPRDIPNPAGIIGLLLSGGFQWDIDCLRYLPSDAPYLLADLLEYQEHLYSILGVHLGCYRFRGSSLLPPNSARFKSELGSNMHG